jgi:spermidine synthase
LSLALSALFFLSGAAGLLFESLWFRQAGLAFGNGVWASSLVLSSFMAGLALGNAVAARGAFAPERLLRVYAALEATIAVAGVALVYSLPEVAVALAPVLRPFFDAPAVLNALRLACAFALLCIPATAMGATLPLLTQALASRSASFGGAFGQLYGWNTLGAVVGALAGEALLIGWLGVRGTALAAAGCNVLAAIGALALDRSLRQAAPSPSAEPARPTAGGDATGRGLAWLAAAFLSGFVLLALEVVWFRFLQLFLQASALTFAVLLATVLAGIGLGGVAGGLWQRRDPDAWRYAPTLSLLAGALVAALYLGFPWVAAPFGVRYLNRPDDALRLAAFLTMPVSFLSGVQFTLLGAGLHREGGAPRRTAGILTLANTAGAGLGSLTAGFVLLPLLGMERSLFALALLYGGVAAFAFAAARRGSRAGLSAMVSAAVFGLAIASFPFDLMQSHFLKLPVKRMGGEGQEVVAVREGRRETIQYLRRDYLGEPESFQLLTDGYSMAGTAVGGRRYMKLYAWWPEAVRPGARRALLVSFGVGSTAKALTETASLEHIDVVDTSREILALSKIVYPDPADNPLDDPRVRVHVEDGRYFLRTTTDRYDLITGEPPPPKMAGVVNLYTREYFELVRSRLAEGGIHTYWLPVHALVESDARAIVRAYCDVFPDCSLWVGTDLDWMLVGTNGARFVPDEERFTAQWRDPRVGAELRAVGIESPEQLGATFLGDADWLRERVGDAAPLTDDFPNRLTHRPAADPNAERARFEAWMDPGAARERFAASRFVRDAWPPALRERTLRYFDYQRIVNRLTSGRRAPVDPRRQMEEVDRILRETELVTLVLWELGLTADQLRIVDAKLANGREPATFLPQLAVRALANRELPLAAESFRRMLLRDPRDRLALAYRAYALARTGRGADAQAELDRVRPPLPRSGPEAAYWSWLRAQTTGSFARP